MVIEGVRHLRLTVQRVGVDTCRRHPGGRPRIVEGAVVSASRRRAAPSTSDLEPGLIGRDAADRLAVYASQVPADQAIVEVGVFLARTTAFLGRGSQAGKGAPVFGVDPWDLPGERYPYKWLNHPSRGRRQLRKMFTQPDTRRRAKRLIAGAGLTETVTLIRGFSVDVAAGWDRPVGLILIDGDHREEFVRADWEAWKPHLVAGAIVCWDDYHPEWPGVMSVVDPLVEAGDVEMLEVLERRGGALAVTRYDP